MPINSFLYPGPTNSNPYVVDNSCRFNNDSSDNLNRTPSSASNRRTFTFSTWFKLSGTDGSFISAGTDISNGPLFIIDILSGGNEGILRVEDTVSGDNVIGLRTNRVLRDISAWMHLVVAIDTTQSTASDRVKVYINGTQETSFGTETYPTQNLELAINNTHEHRIGTRAANTSGKFFDGYMCETVLVDGSALAPTSFGEFDSDSPTIWKPKDVSGLTFGTNGFYLDYKDSSALGNDVSGNNNDWTVNNLTAVDQSTDTCTNNFATMNPLNVPASDGPVFVNGNLDYSSAANSDKFHGSSTIGVSSGKWYMEFKPSSGSYSFLGITGDPAEDARNTYNPGYSVSSWGYYQGAGTVANNNSASSYGDTYNASGDIIGVALNIDDNELKFYKNGTVQNSGTAISITAVASVPAGAYFFCMGDASASDQSGAIANFGSPSFAISSGNSDAYGYGNFEHSVPSGHYALCTKNLAEFGG